MAVLALSLLGAGVVGAAVPSRLLPSWVLPCIAALAAVGFGIIAPTEGANALEPLVEPLAFLVLAVPLAVLLQRLGSFDAAAALADRGGHLALGLWALAALVVAVLNLDAAVVLLTPLYVGIARRHGIDPQALAIQPALLALFASGFLPASNLTNLVAVTWFDLGPADVLRELGPASAAAVVVGWIAYRRWSGLGRTDRVVADPVDGRALGIGAGVVGFLLVGFTVGAHFGVPAWAVVGVALAALAVHCRAFPARCLPFDAVALVIGLATLAAAAAAHVPIEVLVAGSGPLAELRAATGAALGANLVNNLPALLVALPALERAEPDLLWAVLVGVDIGPVILVSGSLSTLLWLRTIQGLGVDATARSFASAGVRIGLPAFAAALVVRLLLGLI